jgi:tetratricopeptide (TPR) repeat protein
MLEAAARIADDGGDPSAALALWRRLYFEHPRSAEASRAGTRLAAVTPPRARFSPADVDRAAERARVLIAAGDGRAALATWDFVLSAIPASSLAQARRLDLAEAAVEGRVHARALGLTGKPPSPRAEPRRALIYGRALFGLGRDTEAKAVLRASAEASGPDAARSRFLYATALDQEDRDREAVDQFLRFIRSGQDGERTLSALWRAAWLSFRLKRLPEARGLFQEILDRPDAAAYHPSALYWLARVEETAARKASAATLYRRLERDFTRDYYGLLAARRIAALGETPAPPPAGPRRSGQGEPGNGQDHSEESLGRPSRAFCQSRRGAEAAARILMGCELETAGLYQDAEREYEAALDPGGAPGAAPGGTSAARETASAREPSSARSSSTSEFALQRGDRTEAIARSGPPFRYLASPIVRSRSVLAVLYPRRSGTRSWVCAAQAAGSDVLSLSSSRRAPSTPGDLGGGGPCRPARAARPRADGARPFTAARLSRR